MKKKFNIDKSFSGFKKSWFIVESDSNDETLEKLSSIKGVENFNFKSLGKLEDKFPKRTERIAYCRNYYLQELENNEKFKNVDFLATVDLDGVNNLLTNDAVKSCWQMNNEWDVCSANQSGPYYDIWALRHKKWSPNDCWKEARELLNGGMREDLCVHKQFTKR